MSYSCHTMNLEELAIYEYIHWTWLSLSAFCPPSVPLLWQQHTNNNKPGWLSTNLLQLLLHLIVIAMTSIEWSLCSAPFEQYFVHIWKKKEEDKQQKKKEEDKWQKNKEKDKWQKKKEEDKWGRTSGVRRNRRTSSGRKDGRERRWKYFDAEPDTIF